MTRRKPLSPAAVALFEAHVTFEIGQWRGRAAPERLRSEVDAFWAWAGKTPLHALLSQDTARAAAERLALDIELPQHLAQVIGEVVDDIVRLEIHGETRIEDVIDKALFEDGVNLFVELEALRNRLIRRVLDSPVYRALAADVLYQGIKDYIFSDNGAISSIPGMSSLFKGSRSAVTRRLPGIDAQVEKRVRAYIENNISSTLMRSEQRLLDSLDEARIRAVADEIWAGMHDKPLSIADIVDADELQRLIDYGFRVWQDLRDTAYVGDLVDEAVQFFFTRHGDTPIRELLDSVGVDRDLLRQEAEKLAPSIVDGLAETGLLEDLIRRRLEPFYRSAEFERALSKDAGN